jgi:DNA helicase-2/ATP-dependent DNA helicase PcrA
LIVNEFDNFSFLLIKDFLQLSSDEYTDIRIKAAETGKSHFQVWHKPEYNLFENDSLGDRAVELDLIFKESMHEDCYSAPFEFIMEWIESNPNGTIQEYLDWLATYDIQDEISDEQKGLQLMTVHAAKGLEWSTVIIAGANEGIMPSKQAIKSGDIESETRLMYVAATRAEDKLILAVRPEQKILDNGKIVKSPISRYVEWMEI